jgi:hypothetical protein
MFTRITIIGIYIIFFTWFAGVYLGLKENERLRLIAERPYRAVMLEAENELQKAGIVVTNPVILPALIICDSCLDKSHTFGAYLSNQNQIVMGSDFNIASPESRSRLIHEYGHYLLTKAGQSFDAQEELCLMLSNSVYQKLFTVAVR